MTTEAPHVPLPLPPPPLPSPIRIGLSRGALELKSFFREKDAVVFTFSLPVIMLVIFGMIFEGDVAGTGVDFRQYFAAGIIASGIMSTTFVNLGIAIAQERDDGTLKRLYGTPLPHVAYFLGKTISALVLSVVETAILFVIGGMLFGLRPPSTPERWLTFAWVFVAGVAVCTLLGIAMSSVPRTGRGAPAALNLPYLILQFISGVFFIFGTLPAGIQQAGALFPLKWLAQGLRSALLPDTLLAAEPGRGWEHGRTALVLTAWGIAGLALCLTTFRWKRRRDR
jgi:ABC-2 type transport system permease protein